MTEPEKHLTDYETFYAKLMSDFDSMASLASDKLFVERMTKIDLPWEDDIPDNEAFLADAREALGEYAVDYCSGDYEALGDMATSLYAARTFLNGPSLPDWVPDDIEDAYPQGIDEDVTAITVGLSSWHPTPTGKLFVDNFVSPIGQRKTENVSSIDFSMHAVETAQNILVGTRQAALKLPAECRKRLEAYNPWNPFDAMDAIFTGIGIIAGPLLSAALVVTQGAVIAQHKDLTTMHLVNAMKNAIKPAGELKVAVEKEVKNQLSKRADKEYNSWASRVCPRPGAPG